MLFGIIRPVLPAPRSIIHGVISVLPIALRFFSISSAGRTLLSEDAAGSQRCVGIALGRGGRSPRLRVASHRTTGLLPESRSAREEIFHGTDAPSLVRYETTLRPPKTVIARMHFFENSLSVCHQVSTFQIIALPCIQGGEEWAFGCSDVPCT